MEGVLGGGEAAASPGLQGAPCKSVSAGPRPHPPSPKA